MQPSVGWRERESSLCKKRALIDPLFTRFLLYACPSALGVIVEYMHLSGALVTAGARHASAVTRLYFLLQRSEIQRGEPRRSVI